MVCACLNVPCGAAGALVAGAVVGTTCAVDETVDAVDDDALVAAGAVVAGTWVGTAVAGTGVAGTGVGAVAHALNNTIATSVLTRIKNLRFIFPPLVCKFLFIGLRGHADLLPNNQLLSQAIAAAVR